ncbi:hypothetical protein ONZ43_g7720 [Nemania bipapillata]|uniref:Uncharacterized protein n=1 Tax=Nemania bipapillata TaxID=110536 RepID=A0ACC2HP20_9PEZI|nr:hypothetical protein ONZ43_g7720 [Nemania bipapillata]
MLVVRPAVNPRKLFRKSRRERLLALPRDVYGFVDYERLRGDQEVFPGIDMVVIEQNFSRYKKDLKGMMSEEMRERVNFRFGVDLDCESIGMTNVEGPGAIYKRSLRN